MNNYRAGFIGLVGQPNAGKSTLLNMLVKEKVAIVNPKPQTTRRRVLGIVNGEQAQAVLVDAPGLIQAEEGLNRFLQEELIQVIESSDGLLAFLNLDEKKFEKLEKIIDMAARSGKPWIPIITKTDLKDKIRRIPIIERALEKYKKRPLLISQKGFGTEERQEVIDHIFSLLPQCAGPLYDLDMYTPHSYRELIAEIIREKCFETVEKEVPYMLAVRIRAYDESSPKIIKIHAEIVVERESHKGILIGENGRQLKKIGMAARKDIEKLVDQKVYLELKVVHRAHWSRNPGIMKELGYEIKREKD